MKSYNIPRVSHTSSLTLPDSSLRGGLNKTIIGQEMLSDRLNRLGLRGAVTTNATSSARAIRVKIENLYTFIYCIR